MSDNNEITIEEMHKHALNALLILDKIFRDGNIRYYLLAGSTLGAVRHKGFIPWDDDIDVGILAEDKERAYRLLSEKMCDGYRWEDNIRNPQWPRLFGKILYNGYGCVDVFVLVKTSNKARQRRVQWNRRKVLFKLYKSKIGYSNLREVSSMSAKVKLYSARILGCLFTKKQICKWIDTNERRYDKIRDNDYFLNLYSAYSLEKELIKRELLSGSTLVEFEGHLFPTVSDTDSYLTHLYGDYMTPPPEKDRVVRHGERFE